jgi:predicted NBD/HSP70 family sugar kinase
LPDVPHVAVFDTAFHATMPTPRQHYALPTALADKHGVRRYGFHGPSHQYVAERAAEALRRGHPPAAHHHLSPRQRRQHRGHRERPLGGDQHGLTPLEGLVMGTRAGDVDPGALLTLLRAEKLDVDGLDRCSTRSRASPGLSGVGNDLRDIEARAAEGDERCRLAIQVFCHRLRKYIGAYAAVLGGVDVIVFTAGIGENSASIRHRVLQRLDFLGARLDEDKNRTRASRAESPTAVISEDHSRTRLMVVATDEAQAIASETAKLARSSRQGGGRRAHPHRHQRAARAPEPQTAGAALRPRAQAHRVQAAQPARAVLVHEKVNLVGPKGASTACASSARAQPEPGGDRPHRRVQAGRGRARARQRRRGQQRAHHARGAGGQRAAHRGAHLRAASHPHAHRTTPPASASPTTTWWRWPWTPRGATSSSATCSSA